MTDADTSVRVAGLVVWRRGAASQSGGRLDGSYVIAPVGAQPGRGERNPSVTVD